jgi:hypothetical protein
MASESPFDDEMGQSPADCWETVQVLREGDTVLINHRDRPLTIHDVIQRDDGETVKRVLLTGNETEYSITAAKEPSTPFITWPAAPHGRPVQRISAAESTILSTVRAQDTLPQSGLQTNRVDTGAQPPSSYEIALTQIVGSCPICDSLVVADQLRVVCQGCGQWCWIEQWEAL